MENQIQEFQKKHKLNSNAIKDITLPLVGKRFLLDGIVYEVNYVRANPCRFTAVPVGVMDQLGPAAAMAAPAAEDAPKEATDVPQ